VTVAPSLFDEPRARITDPYESWAAARSITGLREKQAAVLFVLNTYGPLSLSQLVREYQAGTDRPKQSESGIRTRAHELELMNLVRAEGSRVNGNGRSERLLHTNLSVAVTARGDCGLCPPSLTSPRAVTGTGENQ